MGQLASQQHPRHTSCKHVHTWHFKTLWVESISQSPLSRWTPNRTFPLKPALLSGLDFTRTAEACFQGDNTYLLTGSGLRSHDHSLTLHADVHVVYCLWLSSDSSFRNAMVKSSDTSEQCLTYTTKGFNRFPKLIASRKNLGSWWSCYWVFPAF